MLLFKMNFHLHKKSAGEKAKVVKQILHVTRLMHETAAPYRFELNSLHVISRFTKWYKTIGQMQDLEDSEPIISNTWKTFCKKWNCLLDKSVHDFVFFSLVSVFMTVKRRIYTRNNDGKSIPVLISLYGIYACKKFYTRITDCRW